MCLTGKTRSGCSLTRNILGLAGKFRKVERDGPVDAEDVKQNRVDWLEHLPPTAPLPYRAYRERSRVTERPRNQLDESFPRKLSRHRTCLDSRVRYTN